MTETLVSSRTFAKEGLGHHGYGYLDSLDDTGTTRVPWASHLSGGTGAWGDPRWETLTDATETFLIFLSAGAVGMASILDRPEAFMVGDLVYITPLAPRLRRPQIATTQEPAQVALEDVLGELRSQAGLPVGDLARMLGVSRRQFYNWLSRENQPDTAQEQRARRAAQTVADLHARLGEARLVRAALLTPTDHGTAFDAMSAGDFARASEALDIVLAGGVAPRESVPPSQRVDYDRDRVLLELSHLRDAARHGGDDTVDEPA